MERVVSHGASRVGWFAIGALTAAMAVALFLYADGYFDAKADVESRHSTGAIIEGQ
ncbi:hypothetical protein ACSBOB_18785 [Mesorhizobium sp. ASY16-5R]|uniref:hypothetical protein n=1 Tax=Mesorhizobium sp. ASY16-5R TaxID=3445772 RepID=UPI003FA08BFB